jgi:hypothetical protein
MQKVPVFKTGTFCDIHDDTLKAAYLMISATFFAASAKACSEVFTPVNASCIAV